MTNPTALTHICWPEFQPNFKQPNVSLRVTSLNGWLLEIRPTDNDNVHLQHNTISYIYLKSL